MTDLESATYFKASYRQILSMLETEKALRPEGYKYLAPFVEKYREWTADLSGIGDLPPVPKE